MQFPVIPLDTVYHVGTLDPSQVGRNSGAGSYEGDALSVSLCPQAWTEIARLGGNETHEMTSPGAIFLDVHAVMDDEGLRDVVVEWAVGAGMAVKTTLWTGWSTDENGDWRHSTFATREAALAELTFDMDEDELEAPEGHEPVEAVQALVATDALREATGMRLGADEPAMDACVVAYAKLVLPTMGVDVAGVWWDEIFDPASLSAPRGCIFPDRVTAWQATVVDLDDVEDEERMAAMPATETRAAGSPPARTLSRT